MSIEQAQARFMSYTDTIKVLGFVKIEKKWYYKLECLTCKNIWDLRNDDLKRLLTNKSGGCRICSNRSIAKKNIIPGVQAELALLETYFKIYKTSQNEIRRFICLTCGLDFVDQPYNLVGKLRRNCHPCTNCKLTNISKSLSTQEKVLLENGINDIQLLKRVTTHITSVKCLNCNFEWDCYFGNIIRAKKKWNTNCCPNCDKLKNRQTSSQQMELENFISQYVKTSSRFKLNNGKEIDIYIPSLNIGIEYNGTYYHSPDTSIRVDENYHLNKTKDSQLQNIRLVHIFSPHWVNKKDLCKSKLLNLLGVNKSSVRSNQYSVSQISWSEAKSFLQEFHLMGPGEVPLFSFGLKLKNGNLIGVATFTNKRKGNFREHDDEILEFNRFATSIRCYNAIPKIFELIKSKHSYIKSIISYADLSWSSLENNIYIKNGFSLERVTEPNYWWSKNDLLIPRREAMKHKLPTLLGNNFDPNKTEVANMLLNGYFRVWDCGHARYIINL